jgi:hypothetical protein
MYDVKVFSAFFGLFCGFFGLATMLAWSVMIKLKIKELDHHFDSQDFPLRGYVGLWPWETGRALAYSRFLFFYKRKKTKKKYPHAYENIAIEKIPTNIRTILNFPYLTFIPAMGAFLFFGLAFMVIDKYL